MSSIVFQTALYAGGAAVLSALLLVLPLKVIAILTKPFSLKTFGIRKIKRWHTHTDTLANVLIWISVIFCLFSPWIPWSPILYLIWLIFTWLAATSRAVRLTLVRDRIIKTLVIFFVNLVFFAGLFSTLGFLNHYELWIKSFEFANSMMAGLGLEPTFYITNNTPAAYLLQEMLLIWPLVSLWGQFKYMRLENTFKGSNIVTYGIKSCVLAAIWVGCAGLGPEGIQFVYQQPLLTEETAQKAGYPLSREELTTRLNPPAPEPEQPAPEAQPADPNVVDPNAGVDPNAADPNAPVDPAAVDPNAGVDPAAVDPNAADPNAPVDPAAVDPNATVDPNLADPAYYGG